MQNITRILLSLVSLAVFNMQAINKQTYHFKNESKQRVAVTVARGMVGDPWPKEKEIVVLPGEKKDVKLAGNLHQIILKAGNQELTYYKSKNEKAFESEKKFMIKSGPEKSELELYAGWGKNSPKLKSGY